MTEACRDNVGSALPIGVGVPNFDGNDSIPQAQIVYFISAPSFIKIGFTTDLEHRFSCLSSASAQPLKIIGSIKGDRKTERALHHVASPFRAKGDWYHDTPEVRRICAAALNGTLNLALLDKPRRKVNERVVWASVALKQIAKPFSLDENVRTRIQRAADRVGFTYGRTFELWYAKARRLEIDEFHTIDVALGRVQ